MKSKEYIISIDAGTSKLKVVVYDGEGNEVYIVSTDTNVYVSNVGFMEQDMNELWNVTARCIKEAILKSNIDRNSIKAVAASGQGEGCWLVDNDGNPVTKAVLWNDRRAADIVENIKEDKNFYNEIKEVTGSFPRPGATIILLKWYKKNFPEILQKVKYCISCKDWLRYKLTSEVYCEITDASTSYIDLHTKEYPRELFKKLGIDGAENLFPKLISPCDIGGYVTKNASLETMLPQGICVSGGMLDIVSTSVGSGAVNVGDICTILGTSCINEITTDKFKFEKNMTGWERHLVEGLFINVAGAMAGTPNLDWGLKNIMGKNKFDRNYVNELEKELAQIPVGANGLIYHPYLSLSGERAPFFNPDAAGQISGIKTTTTQFEMMRSIYEGVALSAKDCLASFKKEGKMFLTGGGSRSIFWAQIMADCIGREVVVSHGEEFCAKGGAIAASLACGMYKNPEEAVNKFTKIKYKFEPEMDSVKRYNEIYCMYKEMRKGMDAFWEWRQNFLNNNI